MISSKWKLATALGLAGAIALSVPSAEARGRGAALGFGIAAGALALGAAAAASQPRYYYDDGPYAYYPGGYDSYNYSAPPVYYGAPGPGYYQYDKSRSRGSYDVDRNGNVRGTNYNPNGG